MFLGIVKQCHGDCTFESEYGQITENVGLLRCCIAGVPRYFVYISECLGWSALCLSVVFKGGSTLCFSLICSSEGGSTLCFSLCRVGSLFQSIYM